MKSILLSLGFIALASTATLAQNAQPKTAPIAITPISNKAQFVAGAKELDKNLRGNSQEKTQASFVSLQKAMEQSMAKSKTEIMNAKTEDEKAKVLDVFRKKQVLYSEIHNMGKDMTVNQKAIQSKLAEFAEIGF